MLLFLASVRSTVIVLLSLPLAILASFIGIYFTGNTLNSMTLGGLSLAVGILIDQSIVVTENISRHMTEGVGRFEAALKGTQEVARPVLVSTLTFLVVFFPVVFLKGIAGFLFTPLAAAVVFAMLASFLVSVTLVPTLCARMLTVRGAGSSRFDRIANGYKRLVAATLRLRYAIALAALILVLGGVGLARSLGTESFPEVDAGQFTVLVRAPSGTRIERTEELISRVEATLMETIGKPDPGGDDPDSDLQVLISNIGVLLDWPAAYTPNAGSMDAFVLVQLKRDHARSALEYASELRGRFREDFPGIEFAIDTGGMLTAALNGGLPSPIDVRVEGSRLEILNEIATTLAGEITELPGAVDVRVAQRIDAPAIDVEVDRAKAALLGLTQRDVVENIVTATNSSISFAKSFWIDERNGNHYFIGAQYPEDLIQSFRTLEDVPITGVGGGQTVPLHNVARISRTTQPAVVHHRNITRVFDVYANVEGRDTGSLARDIDGLIAYSPAIAKLKQTYGPKGYRIVVGGETESMRDSFRQFATGLLLAMVLVYLVMVAQFRSFRDPLVILVAVPLGLSGVVIALAITGTALSIPAFMGAIMTVGLVVAYSVLLIEFANRERDRGESLRDAVSEAARIRLRPILMTSLTTVVAMIPLSLGDSANAPLARAILGGVLAAAVLTLFVVPSIYVLFASRRATSSLPECIT